MNGNGTADTRFECTWLNKLSRCLGAGAGERVRDEVMAGSDGLTDRTSRGDVIAWTQRAMERLESAVEQEQARQIMVGCACSHPREELAEMRRVYAQTDDVDRAHAMLQAHFEAFLRNTLKPCEAMIAEAVRRGWGLAGIKQGNTIIATKIPKSDFLAQYLEERAREAACALLPLPARAGGSVRMTCSRW